MSFSGRTKILIVAAFVLIAAAVTAFFFIRDGSGSPAAVTGESVTAAENTTAEAAAATSDTTGAKQDNQGNYEPPAGAGLTNPAAPSLPADVSRLQRMTASVTAVQSVSDDSISVSFYVQGPGNFTVEENDAGVWRVVRENVYYPGTGGLAAATLAPGEQSITLRLLGIAGGQYTSVTVPVTVLRSEVTAAGGIKTYNIS